MSRHPYTHSADYIRELGGYSQDGSIKLSRSDASRIRKEIASVLQIDAAVLATKLSLRFQESRGMLPDEESEE